MFSEIWEKVSIVVAIPIGAGFAGFAILGQICFDNMPYLLCQ